MPRTNRLTSLYGSLDMVVGFLRRSKSTGRLQISFYALAFVYLSAELTNDIRAKK